MNEKLLQYCQKEIQDLLDKGLIWKRKSPWSCAAFYVNKQAELEWGTPCLVINYKPLNQALKWIRYPIPNKKYLLSRLNSAKIFSKFDKKSGFGKFRFKNLIGTKLPSQYLSGNMNGMLCHSVWRTSHQNFKKLWMIYLILIQNSSLST